MITKRLSLRKKHIVISICIYAVALLIGSLLDPKDLSKTVTVNDKLTHSLAYAIFTLLWYINFKLNNVKKNRAILQAVGIATIYGIIIEALQYTITTTRQFDVYDILANTIGVLFTAVLVCVVKFDVKKL